MTAKTTTPAQPKAVLSSAELGTLFSFTQLEAVTMTELASHLAERGFCPKCKAQKLQHISSGGGMAFHQCTDCKSVAVLGA